MKLSLKNRFDIPTSRMRQWIINMNDYYTNRQEYEMQIKVLEDALDEIEKFDGWNNDMANEEIWKIKRAIMRLREKIEPDPSYPPVIEYN